MIQKEWSDTKIAGSAASISDCEQDRAELSRKYHD